MNNLKSLLRILMIGALTFVSAQVLASAATPAKLAVHNIILVHGAWADGSSWAGVIARLQAKGLHVTAVQFPLTNLAAATDATKRVLALQDGPTILVAHSWGGTVISEVGADPKVAGLVYIAARAPDAGEDFVALSGKFPTMPARAGVENNDGMTTLNEDAFLNYFANGVPHNEAEVLYAEQEPAAASLFNDKTAAAGWHTKPVWYAVSKFDKTINPDLERFLAERMNATTIELPAGHLSLVSHAREVSELIYSSAKATSHP